MSIHLSPNLSAFRDAYRISQTGGREEGGSNPNGWGTTYYLANFCRKLHENEEIWSENGVRVPCDPSLNPPLSLKGFTKGQNFSVSCDYRSWAGGNF